MIHWSKYIYGRKEEGGEAVKGGDRMEVKKEKVKGGREVKREESRCD